MSNAAEFNTWRAAVLAFLEGLDEESARYFYAKGVRLGFLRLGLHVSAIWAPGKRIFLNAHYFSTSTPPNDARLQSVLIHELCHLRQGMLTALSVYGELQAWQLGFRVYRQLTGQPYPENLVELMSLPLNLDRGILRQTQSLMQIYATKKYRADLLPLYPFLLEVRYRLGLPAS